MVPYVVARGERTCDWFMAAAQPREAVVAAGYEAEEEPVWKSTSVSGVLRESASG